MNDLYKILEVSRQATKSEIKSAFKKLALLYHPDINQGNSQAEEKFKLINEAYQTLTDDTKRAVYNQKLEYYQFQKSSKAPSPDPIYSSPKNEWVYATPRTSQDYATQGRYYATDPPAKKEKNSDFYFLALTLFVIIATASLLFGFLMNHIAAKEHYKSAILHFDTGNYTKSLMELNKALEFNEKYAEAYILRGDVKIKLTYIESAMSDFKLGIYYSGDPKPEWLQKLEASKKMLDEQ